MKKFLKNLVQNYLVIIFVFTTLILVNQSLGMVFLFLTVIFSGVPIGVAFLISLLTTELSEVDSRVVKITIGYIFAQEIFVVIGYLTTYQTVEFRLIFPIISLIIVGILLRKIFFKFALLVLIIFFISIIQSFTAIWFLTGSPKSFSYISIILFLVFYYFLTFVSWKLFAQRFTRFKKGSVLVFFSLVTIILINFLLVSNITTWVNLNHNQVRFNDLNLTNQELNKLSNISIDLSNNYEISLSKDNQQDNYPTIYISIKNKITNKTYEIDSVYSFNLENRAYFVKDNFMLYKKGGNTAPYEFIIFNLSSDSPQKTSNINDFISCHNPIWNDNSISFYKTEDLYSNCHGLVKGLGKNEYGELTQINFDELDFQDIQAYYLEYISENNFCESLSDDYLKFKDMEGSEYLLSLTNNSFRDTNDPIYEKINVSGVIKIEPACEIPIIVPLSVSRVIE